MKRFRLSVDILHAGQNFPAVMGLLKELNATQDGDSNSWIVASDGTAAELDQRFQLVLGLNDRVNVAEI